MAKISGWKLSKTACGFAASKKKCQEKYLSRRTGLSQPTISNIETGRNTDTRAIVALARVLECDPTWLSTGKGRQCPDDLFIPPEHLEFIKEITWEIRERSVPPYIRQAVLALLHTIPADSAESAAAPPQPKTDNNQ